MPFTGFLKIPDIDGESRRAEHEDEIDVFDVNWQIARSSTVQRLISRLRSRTVATDFDFRKFCDASSVYLAQACSQGRSFDEIVFSVRKDSGDAHLDYLKVTLTNCAITSYIMDGDDRDGAEQIIETVSINAERVRMLYTVQADDHSAGDEHEVEFDLVAGV